MLLITTVNDLRNWVDSALGCDATPADIDGVTETIQDGDHPAWGTDWDAFLDRLDLWSLCMGNAAANEITKG